jgi:hypothetical protein
MRSEGNDRRDHSTELSEAVFHNVADQGIKARPIPMNQEGAALETLVFAPERRRSPRNWPVLNDEPKWALLLHEIAPCNSVQFLVFGECCSFNPMHVTRLIVLRISLAVCIISLHFLILLN